MPSEEMDPNIAAAIAQIWQGPNGAVRVRLRDKISALTALGRHLGMFTDTVKIDAVYGISEEPMSAEEWKKLYVTERRMLNDVRWVWRPQPAAESPSSTALRATGCL